MIEDIVNLKFSISWHRLVEGVRDVENVDNRDDPVDRVEIEKPTVRIDRLLMWKSLAVAAAMLGFFVAGWPVPKVALGAGAVLLLTRRVKPQKVYHEIDWQLLVMFIGLFIVIAGIEKTALSADFFQFAARFGLGRVGVLSAASAVLSNIVSNVPAVLIFKPLIPHLANPRQAWLVLAMSSTLAGNLTLLGSVANLIVVERARHQVRIGFWEYFKVGAPLTLATIVAGILLLR